MSHPRARPWLSRLLLASLVWACALGAGCNATVGPEADGGSDASAGAGLPCAVDAVLASRCRGCHTEPVQWGAPMPLRSYADTQAPAVSDPSHRVAELMEQRVHSATRPMPPPGSPTGPLAADERAALDAWFASGTPAAPAGSPACARGDAGAPDGGPPAALPCTPSHTFRAFGATADVGFAVPAASADRYQCFVLATPFTSTEQAVAVGPVLDDTRVVHHMILYSVPAGSAALTPGTSFDCSGSMPPGVSFVWGWAPGSAGLVMPDGIGLHLPSPDTRLLLQVHYSNAAGLAGVTDRSGVQMCTVPTPRPAEAGFVRLGVTGFAVPPHEVDYAVTGTCALPSATGVLHVLGAAPHMHRTGVALTTDVLRGGDPATVEPLIRVDPWDFNTQSFYPVGIDLRGGDVLRTTCRYTNPTSSVVRNGERTEDEMCLDFVMVHPYAGVVAARRTTCVSAPAP